MGESAELAAFTARFHCLAVPPGSAGRLDRYSPLKDLLVNTLKEHGM
jgi:hypothetical protein